MLAGGCGFIVWVFLLMNIYFLHFYFLSRLLSSSSPFWFLHSLSLSLSLPEPNDESGANVDASVSTLLLPSLHSSQLLYTTRHISHGLMGCLAIYMCVC